jgi:hypothetical protein
MVIEPKGLMAKRSSRLSNAIAQQNRAVEDGDRR